MKAYYVNVSDISFEKEGEFLLSCVCEEKRKKALKFYHKEDAVRTLVGDILVRALLCRELNLKNKDIKYGRNDFNKPRLLNNYKMHFNISHSKDYVAAVIDDEEIGIDIEEIKEMDYEGITKRFFTFEEDKWIKSRKEEDKLKCFYKLWTLKESYVKYKGKGMHISFDTFGFETDNDLNFKLKDSLEKVHFFNYDVNVEYELSICTLKKNMQIEEVTYENIKKLIINYL